MPAYGPNLKLASNGSWDFPLIANCEGIEYQYTPKSDASLRVNKFPRFLLEIVSDQARSNRSRTLLQAACTARLGSQLKRESAGSLTVPADPFIISAVYIDEELCAQWYFVYQPSARDNAVGLILQEAVLCLRVGRLSM
jgi:hypothetical protein